MILTQVALPFVQNGSISIADSKTIGLTFFNSNSSEQPVSNTSDYFHFKIPRTNQIPLFKQLNTHNSEMSSRKNLLTLDGFMISTKNVSIHYQLKPTNLLVGYFVALRFGSNPYLNRTIQLFDMFQIFCPLNDLTRENNDSFYTLFANMSKTINFTGFIGIGIKQLLTSEFTYYCINKSNYSIENIDNQIPVQFTGNISVRVFLSGCYYVNKLTGLYSSYGMEVLSTSNTTYTQCISNHLTDFASGWIVLPNAINFDDVWSNASFTKNMTIYITVIVIGTIYFILLIWAQINDRNDMIKSEIKSFSSNQANDSYFYELAFNFKLPLNVKMILHGTDDSSRIFKIEKMNSNLRYILSVKNSLGKILSIDVIEVEKLKNGEKSLFSKLKCTVHNLLTREENHLYFKESIEMFSIKENEENHQSKNKVSLSCILSNTSLNLKEKHELFSIFCKPVYSPFSRTDRLTCFFTLLFMALLMEIMYYDTEVEAEEEAASLTDGLVKFEITTQTVC
jgi:hypothetical protein